MRRGLLWATFVVALLVHGAVYLAWPAGYGPDGSLYVGSSLELFQSPIRNPYILMDRNGYYPFLVWLFRLAPRGIEWLVEFQHLVVVALTVATVRLAWRTFGRIPALLSAMALCAWLPLLQAAQVTNSEAAGLMALWACAVAAEEWLTRRGTGGRIPWWLWCGFGGLGALAVLARPSGVLLVAPLFLSLFVMRVSRQRLAGAAAVSAAVLLTVPTFNLVRLGYFGLEKKSGRTLFALVWMTDHSYRPDNGPASREIASVLRREWPRLLRENEVVRRNNEDIADLLADAEHLPWHLYYLIVNLLRADRPARNADGLMRAAALEAVRREPGLYLRRRASSFLSSFNDGAFRQLGYETDVDAVRAGEDAYYASRPGFRYRGAAILYRSPGYEQTPQQCAAFLAEYENCLGPRRSRVAGLVRVLARLDPLRKVSYLALWALAAPLLILLWRRSGVLQPRMGVLAAACFTLSLMIYNLGNRAFVYLVSAGTTLHMLPGLAFHLLLACAGLGVATAWGWMIARRFTGRRHASGG